MPLPERELIARIRRMAGAARDSSRLSGVLRGIGDDCAVLRLPAGHEMLVTTDFSIEGVHFRRDWQSPEAIGHRCLARGLSDIAAMGGEPVGAFLSFGMPAKLEQAWVARFVRGFLRLAKKHETELAGGDLSASPGQVVADVTVVGKVRRGCALLRSGARPGDKIYVTGKLGGAAALLEQLRAGKQVAADDQSFFPDPRIGVGRRLTGIATSCIDLSDGLSTDLGHICEESRVAAVIHEPAIPIAKGATSEHALHGGEDYELLFTARAPVPTKLAGVRVSEIGTIRRGEGVKVASYGTERRLRPGGWEHFEGRSR